MSCDDYKWALVVVEVIVSKSKKEFYLVTNVCSYKTYCHI